MSVNTGDTLTGLRVCMHVLGTGRSDVRVMRAAKALTERGCAISVVDIEHDPKRPACETIDGIHFRHSYFPAGMARFYQPVGFARWIAFKALRVLRGIPAVVRVPADVYHAHDVTALPACYLAAVLRRKVLVYDAHELPLVDPHQTQHRIVCSISTWLLKVIMRRCDAVITVSPPLVEQLQRRYGGQRAVIVRNMPPYRSQVASRRLHQALDLGPDSCIALYQGNFQLDRGLDLLVAAAGYLQAHQYLVLMGKDLTDGQLTRLIDEAGHGDHLRIVPAVPYDELFEWTASADLGLIVYRPDHSPNVRYCLPNKVFEYFMAGVPVLATSLDAVAELIDTFDTGIVVTDTQPAGIARAISTLLDDHQSRARMHSNALIASHTLCWERESRVLVDLYQRVGRGRRAAHGGYEWNPTMRRN